MPIRVVITAGAVADCTKACELISGIEAENLTADRGYDTNQIPPVIHLPKLNNCKLT